MKAILLALCSFASSTALAQAQPVVGNFHIGNTSLSLNAALSKVSSRTPIQKPDGVVRLERDFTSKDGAFKIVCSESFDPRSANQTTCDISIDSTRSNPSATKVSIGTYTPVVVVEFADSTDQAQIEKMVTVGTLHSVEKVSLTAVDGKVLEAYAWELTPGSRTSTKKTTFVLAAPFDQAMVDFQVTDNFELYKSANGTNVIQDGVVKFRFAPEVDVNRAFCYVSNAQFLPTQGIAKVETSQEARSGRANYKINFVPDDAIRTIYCESESEFSIVDAAATLKGIIDVQVH